MSYFAVVNDAYAVEFDNPRSHKRLPRFVTLDDAREYLSIMWIATAESGEIVGCVCAKASSFVWRHHKSNIQEVHPKVWETKFSSSVTKFGNLLDFVQLFKAFGNNYFAQISHILRQFFKGVKIYHFSSEIIFKQLL